MIRSATLVACFACADSQVQPVDAGLDASDASCTRACDGAKLVDCSLGTPVATTCALGCVSDSSGPHCDTFVPTGALAAVDFGAATAQATLEGTRPYWFDTDTGHIEARETGKPSEELRAAGEGVKSGIGFFVFPQTGGPEIGAFTYKGMVIAKASSLHFYGARVAGLVFSNSIHIDGWIYARSECATDVLGGGGALGSYSEGGACKNTAKTTGACGASSNPNSAGGGGGGNGTAGALGGDANLESGGTAGEALAPLLQTPFVLVGGGGGGGGGRLASAPADPARPCAGGAGGGALHIVAQNSFVMTGGIDLGACGGRAAVTSSPQCAGGGGGAGGTLFIEAPTATIHPGGIVVANGGAGAGASDLGGASAPGDGARSDATPANGGAGAGACNTIGGGAGGAMAIAPTQPAKCGSDASGWLGAGGGGAVGRIALKTLSGGLLIDSTAIVSPKNEAGTIAK